MKPWARFRPEELMEIVKAQRQKFIEKFGRNPGPGDKLFFDAPPLEHVEHMIVPGMKQVGVDPAIIHAFEKTGLIVTEPINTCSRVPIWTNGMPR